MPRGSVLSTLEPSGANADQIRYWNESGAKWVALHDAIDLQIRPLGLRAMDRAALHAGDRALDVGCGCGATTIELARRVAPGGSVTGIDISAVMLDEARRRAAAIGAAAQFMLADAQTYAFAPASVDVVFSRFGVMFFVNPTAAFANLRRALRPEGRLAFVCWRSLPENPWMFVPLGAALQVVPPPLPTPAPDAPGPFAFADPNRVRGILDGAGYRDVQLDAVDDELIVGGGAGLDETVAFMLQMGPTGILLRAANDPSLEARVAAAVREALVPYVTPAGVRMRSASWIVTARA